VEIRSHAAAQPDRPATIVYPAARVVTFGELEARANRLAHYFRKAGLRSGDAIAILMENNEHMHSVMWAARRAGLYYVPINTHLTAAEAAYIVDNSNAVGIIGSAALRATLEALGGRLPRRLPELLIIADDDLDGWLRYPECVADQPDTPIDLSSRVISCSIRPVPPDARKGSSANCLVLCPPRLPSSSPRCSQRWASGPRRYT
jgi:long-chain acyl-CoA synthetase